MLGLIFGAMPLGARDIGAATPFLLTKPDVDDSVYLFELLPSAGSGALVYKPEIFGAYPFGSLPHQLPDAPVVPLHYSDKGFTERQHAPHVASDNRYYEGRAQLPQIEQSIAIVPGSGDRTVLSAGELIIDNTDGLLDGIAEDLAIDSRPAVIKWLPSRAAELAEAVAVFTGVGESWLVESNVLRVQLRDNLLQLETPLQSRYTGTGGADGTADNVGQPIMQVYGLCRNVEPTLIDPVKQIYQIHDRAVAGFDAVRVRGASVTIEASQANYESLAAASVSRGACQTVSAASGSYMRLGSMPDGIVTVDVRGDAYGSYIDNVTGIMQRLATRVLPSSILEPTSFSSLSSVAGGKIGIVFSEGVTVAQAMASLCTATYTYLTTIADGRLAIGRLALPMMSGGLAIGVDNLIGKPERLALPAAVDPCVWRVRVGYRRNWRPLTDGELVPVGTITAAQRQEYKEEQRYVQAADTDRLQLHRAAKELELQTVIDEEADAQMLADFLLALFAPGRAAWQMPLPNIGHAMPMNYSVTLSWPRSGLRQGKNLRIAGKIIQRGKVTLVGFG